MTNDVFAETLENLQPSVWLISGKRSRISNSSNKISRTKTMSSVKSLPASFEVQSHLFVFFYYLFSDDVVTWDYKMTANNQ
jgi:hypothetical protein